MTFTQAIHYITKAHSAISALNRRVGKSGISGAFSYWDFIWSYVRYGCLINQYANGNFWRYRKFERKKIMTYRRVCQFIHTCNSPKHIYKLENKVEFNKFFSEFINRKWVSSAEMQKSDLMDLINTCNYLIIKPIDDYEGHGIEMIESKNFYGENLELLFNRLKEKDYIIEERIYNHPGLDFNNNSINTIRINSLLDSSGKVHIFKPVLRAGVGQAFVDNYNAGGCEYAIDVESGIIISQRYHQYVLDGLKHPGCEIIMLGYQIPMWREIIKMVEKAFEKIPECRFVAWDIAVTTAGPQFIEGNHRPGNVSIEYFGEVGWYDKLKKYL